MYLIRSNGLWLMVTIFIASPSMASSSTGQDNALAGYQSWQAPVVADWRETNRKVSPPATENTNGMSMFDEQTPATESANMPPEPHSAHSHPMPGMHHGDHH